MQQVEGGMTLPGWRDFERAVALAFGGEAQESKAVFDVLLPTGSTPAPWYGLSCKMRRELDKVKRTGRVYFELSNSAGQFWDSLRTRGIDQTNYRSKPAEVGRALIEVVESWHHAASAEHGGTVDLAKSSYLVLSWNRARRYQLHQFRLTLPDPDELRLHFPSKKSGEPGRRLAGDDDSGTLFEWYGESGGQLKYYALASTAVWSSDVFQMEPLENIEYGILKKAAAYFPEKWSKCT